MTLTLAEGYNVSGLFEYCSSCCIMEIVCLSSYVCSVANVLNTMIDFKLEKSFPAPVYRKIKTEFFYLKTAY